MLLPLRFPRLWLTLGWVFVVLAVIACLVPGGVPGTSRLNDKFMHVCGHLALALWFTGIYPRSRYAMIAFLLLALGIVIELLQGAMHMGRAAELRDVYADAVGIAAGIALSLALLGGWMLRFEAWIAPAARSD
jgi:VanZ family protein